MRITVFIWLVVFSSLAFAQSFQPSLGSEFKYNQYKLAADYNKTIAFKRNILIHLKKEGNRNQLLVFDESQNFVKAIKLELQYENLPIHVYDVANVNGKLKVFGAYINRTKKINALMAFALDLETEQLSDPKLLATNEFKRVVSSKSVAVLGLDTYLSVGGFEIVFSKDSSFMAIIGKPFIKNNKRECFEVNMYDKNLKFLWKNKVDLQKSAKEDIDVRELSISYKGEVYFSYLQKKRKFKDKYNRDYNAYHVFINKLNKEKLITEKIEINNRFINSLIFTTTLSGDILLYVLSGKSKRSDGDIATLYSFNERLIQINEENYKLEQTSRFLRFQELIEWENGDLTFVSEVIGYDFTILELDRNGESNEINHGILVHNISKKMNRDWNMMISKRQVTIAHFQFFNGFELIQKDDKIHFLFVDNMDNKAVNSSPCYQSIYYPLSGEFLGPKNGIALVTIDLQGDGKKKFLGEISDFDKATYKVIHIEGKEEVYFLKTIFRHQFALGKKLVVN